MFQVTPLSGKTQPPKTHITSQNSVTDWEPGIQKISLGDISHSNFDTGFVPLKKKQNFTDGILYCVLQGHRIYLHL